MTHEQQLTPISIGFLGTPSPTGKMPVLARQTEFRRMPPRGQSGWDGQPSCSVPECEGIRQTDPAFREALWARYFMAAPRPRTPSELRYSDRRLRSKSLRHSMG